MDEKLNLDNDDLLPEYDVDYAKAKPNYFAAHRTEVEKDNSSDLTQRFNAVYENRDSTLDPIVAQMQRESLGREEWK